MSRLSWESMAGADLLNLTAPGIDVSRALRRILLHLATEQGVGAAAEAAAVPYWKPCPVSVIGLRAAARALRELAEALPATASPDLSGTARGSRREGAQPSLGGESRDWV